MQLMIDTKISTEKSEVDISRLEAGNIESEVKYAEEGNVEFFRISELYDF